MLEREIVAAIKKYLSSLGSDVFFWKKHGGPYGCAGIAQCGFFVLAGIVWAMEEGEQNEND